MSVTVLPNAFAVLLRTTMRTRFVRCKPNEVGRYARRDSSNCLLAGRPQSWSSLSSSTRIRSMRLDMALPSSDAN